MKNYDFTVLGVLDVFDSRHADLSGISSPPLSVSKTVQAAHVKIDEKGTEPIVLHYIAYMTPLYRTPTVPLTVDHPFIFIIQHEKSGAILFMGRLSNPAAGALWGLPIDGSENNPPEFETNRSPIRLPANGATSFTETASDADGDDIIFDIDRGSLSPNYNGVLDTVPILLPCNVIQITDHDNGTATISIDFSNVIAPLYHEYPQYYRFWLTASDGTDTTRQVYAVVVCPDTKYPDHSENIIGIQCTYD